MKSNPPMETYLLVTLLIFLSLAAIYGGISLIVEPGGNILHLNIENYRPTYPFSDFMFPGVMLLVLFGILPLLLIYPLIKKPRLSWAWAFNFYIKKHWAWTYALFLGIILVFWVDVQIYMIGFCSSLQILNSLYGLAIIVVCLLPKQLKYFSKWKLKSHRQKISEDEESI
jgi:hypothetical protein